MKAATARPLLAFSDSTAFQHSHWNDWEEATDLCACVSATIREVCVCLCVYLSYVVYIRAYNLQRWPGRPCSGVTCTYTFWKIFEWKGRRLESERVRFWERGLGGERQRARFSGLGEKWTCIVSMLVGEVGECAGKATLCEGCHVCAGVFGSGVKFTVPVW